MKKKETPRFPQEREETIRRGIISLLEQGAISAKDISKQLKISEKEAYPHLEHIRKTVNKAGKTLIVTPPLCRKCGFEFKKRERLKKPGKCPLCRATTINEPLFSIS